MSAYYAEQLRGVDEFGAFTAAVSGPHLDPGHNTTWINSRRQDLRSSLYVCVERAINNLKNYTSVAAE